MFGHTRFKITDTTLFADLEIPNSISGREVVINNSQSKGTFLEKASFAEGFLVCYYGYVCGTPTQNPCVSTGCDYNNCPLDVCYATATCFEFEIDYGSGGGGGMGGDPPPGGGGGYGSWEPPNCQFQNVEGCIPGWQPLDPSENPPPDPCDKVLPLTTDSVYIEYALQIENVALNGSAELAWIKRPTGDYYMKVGPWLEDYIVIPVIENTENVNHSHFLGKMFSVSDLETLYDFIRLNFANPNSFTLGLSNEDGESYVLTVDDPSKFLLFGSKYFSNERKTEQLNSKYSDYKIGNSNDSETNEFRFLELIEDLDMGISMLKADDNFTKYDLLEKSSTQNEVNKIPCNN